ncbi:hypothetical protein HGD90_06635 [Rhodobacteraceae bacterium R_SAG7]|nr:hypothetical protein [Rhodobacteraceae bacterium R_SAG7]
MAEISEVLLHIPTLQALEGIAEFRADLIAGQVHHLGFNVSVPSELSATSLAFGNIVVGVVVGEFKGGGVGPA